jgi:hypothetical protein
VEGNAGTAQAVSFPQKVYHYRALAKIPVVASGTTDLLMIHFPRGDSFAAN